ncbi:hypothetical protein [Microbacterium oleivorans]|uniref:LPXTG-domain-containing protein cell wall anchor domain protein n=1 Tax=Microbacterium oleivorans TaxID=273677 RepID=A0A031FVY0_9MICO|nr:hypothetical protein [Microbacterium oleivorans]AZS44877.1 hypothetical protein BWL13_02474 [Microbacterium oleivorans]EZP29019.1 LPXTG-domain-containing protein cell wall anchor domain protein [Microbacterium oleivorans]THE08416.1 hypothetical protein E1I21_02880 [Microbacterium oleivorans]
MKNKISKAAAALVVAAAAVFAAPAVANAYAPSAPANTDVIVAPGAPVTLPFSGFEPQENVTFTLTGEGVTDASLAFVAFAAGTDSTTEVKEANEDGTAAAVVTLPDNASGTYTLSAVGETSGAANEDVTITVAATGGTGGGVLPNNGFDGDALLGLWVGGGVLVLAGASIAVAASVRRARQTA